VKAVVIAGFVAAVVFLIGTQARAAEPGQGDRNLFIQADGHVAVFNDAPDRQFLSGGLGYGLRAGWRWSKRLGAFIQGGHAAWFKTGHDRKITPGVLNVGVGLETRFFDDRLRTSLAGGSSTLLFDTTLDSTGTTGWFANLRPAGLRWSLGERAAFQLDPVTFMVMQPVTTRPRLTKIEYQTVLALEFR